MTQHLLLPYRIRLEALWDLVTTTLLSAVFLQYSHLWLELRDTVTFETLRQFIIRQYSETCQERDLLRTAILLPPE
jgi:hypothetical protein